MATLRLNSIPKSVRDSFHSALSLPDATLGAIGRWIKINIDTLSSGEFNRLDPEAIATEEHH